SSSCSFVASKPVVSASRSSSSRVSAKLASFGASSMLINLNYASQN
ncbi:MAG: hypothetical protein DGJ47_000869, partial [Rickettsiaceae bacterium]